MKKIILTVSIVAFVSLRLLAGDAKDYQVTGPVLEVQGHGLLQDDRDGNRDEAGQEIIRP